MEKGYSPSTQLLEWACLAWVQYISHRGLAYDDHPYIPWMLHEDDDDYETRKDYSGTLL